MVDMCDKQWESVILERPSMRSALQCDVPVPPAVSAEILDRNVSQVPDLEISNLLAIQPSVYLRRRLRRRRHRKFPSQPGS